MAESTKSKKITDISKDFALDTKAVIALFKSLGIEKANSGASVSDAEAELFVSKFSLDNQLDNFDDYLDKKATLKTDRPKSAADKKQEKPEGEEKPELQKQPKQSAEQAPQKKTPKADVLSGRVTVSSSVKKSQLSPDTQKPQSNQAVQSKPAQNTQRPQSQPSPQRQAQPQMPQGRASGTPDRGSTRAFEPNRGGAPGQSQNRQPRQDGTDRMRHGDRSNTSRTVKSTVNMNDIERKMAQFREEQERRAAEAKRNRAATGAPQTPALAMKEAAQKAAESNTQAAAVQTQASAAPAAKPKEAANTAAQAAAQKAAQSAVAATRKRESVDRFNQKPTVQNQPKAQQKKDESKDKRSSKIIIPVTGAAVPSGGGDVVVTAAPKTRIVDTRTTVVDLSKYDERLDKFAPGVNDQSVAKQKLKKQDSRAQGKSAKEKDRIAREKIKRLEAEMAHKKQLEITVPDEIVVSELAVRLKKTSAEVIRRLMKLGVMASVNETVDYDTAFLIAEEFGAKVTKEVVVTIEEKLFDDVQDTEENLVPRSAVVCVMGHVDHGKTSLLDAIRHTNVTSGEAGGITQAIGAYRVMINGSYITFLDTPGHEAFTAMRARGAQATDIAILVVAADDGIMPQTVEAINHAKAAGVDVIVAINKMDKPHANPDQVMQELTKYDLLPEEWGGDTICVPVSALTGMGIDKLLESILLVAEVKELKANPARHAKGLIIEARLDKGRGPVATVLVQTGTLHHGDIVIAGTSVGRVRAMTDDQGRSITSAGPSVPVEIDGLSEVPLAGDEFNAVEDEKMARSLAEQRREKTKQESFSSAAKVSLDDLFARISEGVKTLNIIVKADVGGSAEAVKASLVKITNDEVKVNVIHTAVGGITENDVMLAAASSAIIVGFNVRPDKNAIDSAERQGVDIRTYRIIYECIEEITAAMKGMLAPKFKEVLDGHAQVRQTIHVPNVGTIAGSYVQDGKVTRRSLIRVIRDGVVIAEDKISSLRRFKDDVKEVASGYECGIGLDRFNDIKINDVLEAYQMQEVER